MRKTKISFFSILDKIGLALLISSSFYFYERSFIFSSKSQILIQYFVLLIFSYLILTIIIIFLRYLDKNEFNFTKKLFLVILFSWLVVVFVKSIFFLVNYISLSELLLRLLNIEIAFVSKNELVERTLVFILPYLISFFLILVFSRDFSKFKKLLITYGFVSIIIIPIDLFQSKKPINIIKDYGNLDVSVSSVKNLDLIEKNNNKKVLLVIFDELDFELVFQNLDYFPNISKIIQNGFFAKKMFPPAINTITSIPSLLMGEPTKGNYYINDKFYLVNQNNKIVNFNLENTLFGKLEKNNYKYEIFSSGIDYCTTLKIKNSCKAKKFNELKSHKNFLKGISFTYSIFNKSFLFFKLLTERKIILENLQEIKELKIINNELNDLDGHGIINFEKFKKILNNENLDLIYLHLSLPHLPANYAEKVFNVKTPKDMRSYFLNLKLLDLIMNKIYGTYINSEFFQDSILLFTSDHWARDKDTSQSKAFPVFFFSKIYDDNSRIISDKKMSSVNLSNFIINFYNGQITNNKDIGLFYEKNKFYKTYLPKLKQE
tara:strand:- start:290 stop:1927 length:1638 start_codon:yes stop_codon:yes gene_type:complete